MLSMGLPYEREIGPGCQNPRSQHLPEKAPDSQPFPVRGWILEGEFYRLTADHALKVQ